MAAGTEINLFDIILGGITLFGAYQGYNDGLKQPLMRASILVALLSAFRYYTWFDTYLVNQEWVTPQYGPYASGILVFSIVFVFLQVIFSGMTNFMAKSPVAFSVDKLIGVIWGGFKYVMIASFATMAMGMVGLPPASWTNGSVLYPPIKDAGMSVVTTAFSEIPLAQKVLGEFERIFRRAGDDFSPKTEKKTEIQNPISPSPRPQAPSPPPTNAPVLVDVIPPPPVGTDRSIRNIGGSTTAYVPPKTTQVVTRNVPDYPRHQTPEEKKIAKPKPKTPYKPPTIR